MIFDLDGTLLASEQLKARSYARAVVELCPFSITADEVIEYFKEVVGLSRQEVALKLMEHFRLEEAARVRMEEFSVTTPWQAFLQLRLQFYETMLANPETIRTAQWPHNVGLLHEARRSCNYVALATMSHRLQVQRVLSILEIVDYFDFIATRDDVERGKPNPEMYLLVARELNLTPADCLVIEDSPAGVQAALAAGMQVIAVTTPFTRAKFQDGDLLSRCWVVDDPVTLPDVVRQRVALMNSETETIE